MSLFNKQSIVQTRIIIDINEVSNMAQTEPIIKKSGNATIIIMPPSAKTEEEIQQVMRDFDTAVYEAWLDIQVKKQIKNEQNLHKHIIKQEYK